jgi:hypothetical protein
LRIRYKGTAYKSMTYTVPVNEWHFYTVTWEGSNAVVFVDGAAVGFITGTGNYSSSEVAIGRNTRAFAQKQSLTGEVEEFRASNIPRSRSWIRAEFRNQIAPSGFYSISSEEHRPYVILIGRKPYTIGKDMYEVAGIMEERKRRQALA